MLFHIIIHELLMLISSCAEPSCVLRQLSPMDTSLPLKPGQFSMAVMKFTVPSTCCYTTGSLSSCITLRVGTIIFSPAAAGFCHSLSQFVSIASFSCLSPAASPNTISSVDQAMFPHGTEGPPCASCCPTFTPAWARDSVQRGDTPRVPPLLPPHP